MSDKPAPEFPRAFPSWKEPSDRITAWLESTFGVPVTHENTYRTLCITAYGVEVVCRMYEAEHRVKPYMEWAVGINGRRNKAGYCNLDDNLDKKVPASVLLAAEYVRLRKSSCASIDAPK